jgi:hypothetical protein
LLAIRSISLKFYDASHRLMTLTKLLDARVPAQR